MHRLVMRVLWSRAKALTANSQWLATVARKTWPQAPITVIPNGVDTDLFRPVPPKDKFTAFTVTAGGTVMGKKKRLDVLIAGFAEFVQAEQLNSQEAQLLLIGDGDEYAALVQLVRDKEIESYVQFVGAKDRKWIAQNLPRCHVFCLPSVAEGMSNAALEAMACGLPLILSDVGAAREMVDGNGVVLQSVTPESISQTLSAWQADKTLLSTMSRRSVALSAAFSWSRVARELKEVW
ncbi:glycosyltransferase family 4 protein [Candidatus Woesebacteria bacterium]|nr:glycosyltransferase family 4 protein [Candidatus Woesebacteria bacterium]